MSKLGNDIVDFWEWLKQQPPWLIMGAIFLIIVLGSQIGGCCHYRDPLWWLPG